MVLVNSRRRKSVMGALNGSFAERVNPSFLAFLTALFIMASMVLLYWLLGLRSNNSAVEYILTTMKGIESRAHSRAAIVSLITGSEADVENLCTALTNLQHLPDVTNANLPLADVVIFHEPNDLSIVSMAKLSNCTDRATQYAEVDFTSFPQGFDPEKEESRWQKRSKWGYSQMIRFFISGLWQHPVIGGYDSVMRLDADSCWSEISRINPEQPIYPYLPDGVVYQRNRGGKDGGYVCEGLYDFTSKYISTSGIAVANPELWQKFEKTWIEEGECLGFSNNFEITNVQFMQQSATREWHEAVTERPPFGVYRHRWGDALVRYLTLALFAPPSRILYHNITAYYHHPCSGHMPVLVSVANGQKVVSLPKMPSQVTLEGAKSLILREIHKK